MQFFQIFFAHYMSDDFKKFNGSLKCCFIAGKSGPCSIEPKTKDKCSFCRLNKYIKAGMDENAAASDKDAQDKFMKELRKQLDEKVGFCLDY